MVQGRRAHRSFSREFKLEAVRRVQARPEGISMAHLGRELGVRPAMLRDWVKQVEAQAGAREDHQRHRRRTRAGQERRQHDVVVPQHLGDGGIEQRLAATDRLQGRHEIPRPDLLEEVAGCAGHDRRQDRLLVRERRQHDNARVGQLGANFPAGFDP